MQEMLENIPKYNQFQLFLPKSGFEAAAGLSFSFVEDPSSEDFVFLNFSSISFICFS